MSFQIDNFRELAQVTTYEDVSLALMRWGMNNSYPQTFLNLIAQSPSASTAITRAHKFYKGGDFVGSNMIVNKPKNLTLGDVVDRIAFQFAVFGGFSAHSNFNLMGQAVDITPQNLTDIRLNQLDELEYASKFGYFYNFGHNSEIRKTVNKLPTRSNIKWMNRFNPEYVGQQMIEAGGISDYLGQLLFYSNAGSSKYPIPPLQAAINFVLADVENSILMRKETSTGFISTFLLKTSLPSDDKSLEALEQSIVQAQGARGYGKVITFSGMPADDVKNSVLEEVGAGGAGAKAVVESAKGADELIEKKIIGRYNIPSALAGTEKSTGISGSELEDAYFIYNSITQENRDIIEREINKVLANSVFPIKSIKLTKLTLNKDEDKEDSEPTK